MSWVTVIWSMIASVCVTLAGIYLLVWRKNRAAWANLLFSMTALAAAAFAFCELSMMLAETPGEFGTALRWGQVALWVWTLSLVGFVLFYLQAGRPWLAWAACGLRTFTLLPNFLVGQNLNYREITALRHIRFLGESVSVAEGVPNPWMLVGRVECSAPRHLFRRCQFHRLAAGRPAERTDGGRKYRTLLTARIS